MNAEAWQWFWLGACVALALAELFTPFLFFMISFAIGAALAAVAAFLGVGVAVQWLLFVAGSVGALALLVPLGRRLERVESDTAPEGSNRWIGRVGEVLDPIPGAPHATGLVRLERERWRAETPGRQEIPAGTHVMVLRVKGTRLIVVPADSDNVPPLPEPDQSQSKS
jgi:membrane protein implicated in regulation of membrane protease activity